MHRNARSSLHTTRLVTLATALTLAAGCAQQIEPQTTAEPDSEQAVQQSVLDPEILAAAMQQEAALEAQGISLRERVWMSADAYAASYETAEGTSVSTQMIGKNSIREAMPMLRQEESFEEFAARAMPRTALRVKDLAADKLWFDPPQPTEDPGESIGKTTAALSDLEQVAQILAACDAKARANCKEFVGYYQGGGLAPMPVTVWSRTGQPGTSFGGRGSAFYAAACAHANPVSFQWFSNNWRFYVLNPASLVQGVPPLAFFSLAVGTGWKRHKCGFLEICNEYADFNQADLTVNTVAGSGSDPVQTFCGKITDQPRMWLGGSCSLPLGVNCIGFEQPTDVVRSIVSN